MQAEAQTADQLVRFLGLAERLKRELRHSWLSDGRQESVAEHTWFIALMALLSHGHLRTQVSLERVLAMAVVHDLAEAKVGDIPYFETGDRKRDKAKREQEAMEEIAAMLPSQDGQNIRALWLEFEEGETPEAKFVRALDHLEVQAQHNLAALSSWEPIEYDLVYTKMDERCAHEPILQALLNVIRNDAEVKMAAGGVDVEDVKRRTAKDRLDAG